MAVGAGHFLGIQVPANFRAPYTARSITEFWQKWHITLSTWFRDYLFLPMSRFLLRRARGRHPDQTRTVSLLFTMSLIGFWHGPNWTYLVWGVYQGLLLAIHAQSRSRMRQPWPAWAGRTLTTLVLLLGWVCFRSGSLGMAASLYASMFDEGWGRRSPRSPASTRLPAAPGRPPVLTNLPDMPTSAARRGVTRWVWPPCLHRRAFRRAAHAVPVLPVLIMASISALARRYFSRRRARACRSRS
jgi:hypothetical protein